MHQHDVMIIEIYHDKSSRVIMAPLANIRVSPEEPAVKKCEIINNLLEYI